jgi:hypothetical protein
MRTFRFAIPLIAFAALAGCALFPTAAERAEARTPSYRQGYADGCAASSAQGVNYRAGPYRDEVLYKVDRIYRNGWENGYVTCQRTQTSPGSQLDKSVLEPSPGH